MVSKLGEPIRPQRTKLGRNTELNSFQIQLPRASYSADVGAHKAVLYLFDWFKRLSCNHNCTNYLRNALTGYIAAIE